MYAPNDEKYVKFLVDLAKDENGFELLNWDDECRKDLITGKGIRIFEKTYSKKKEVEVDENGKKKKKPSKKKKNYHGIQSSFFGSDWDDRNSFAEKYSCECGRLQSKEFEGITCPVCKSRVKFIDSDVNKTGWMILDKYYVIQPGMYMLLTTAIGKKRLEEIITYDREMDVNGHPKPLTKEELKNNPFKAIGIIEFRERFEEVMYYFRRKNKKKASDVDFILDNKDNVFTSCIPVYSALLRVNNIRNELHYIEPVETIYNKILSAVNILNKNNDESDLIITTNQKGESKSYHICEKLSHCQKNINELWLNVFEKLNSKSGMIKEDILAGRVNFSSRQVIILDASLRAYETKMGYKPFMELYKLQIIAHLAKIQNITHNEAYNQWFEGLLHFSPKIYEIMKYMITEKDRWCIVNRNPTNDHGSMLCLKIVDIIPELDYYALSLSTAILTGYNADFDGDILNVVELPTEDLVKAFKEYNPLYMFISHVDGLLNNNMMLIKDEIIGLHYFNKI